MIVVAHGGMSSLITMAEHMHWPVGLTMDAMEEQPDCEVDDLRHGLSQREKR